MMQTPQRRVWQVRRQRVVPTPGGQPGTTGLVITTAAREEDK
jgi:hypothetical protein